MRQVAVGEWCRVAFGAERASSVEHRALRFLEEAIELYQAAGAKPEQAHALVDYVFARASGELSQELGQVGVTVLALAEAARVYADECESAEVQRILSRPVEYYAERNAAKDAAGFGPPKELAQEEN